MNYVNYGWFEKYRARDQGITLLLLAATALVLSLAFFLGGASRLNATQVTIVEFASLPLAAFAIWRLTVNAGWANLRGSMILIAAAVLIPLYQLIPLPVGLWAQLPGHQAAADMVRLAGSQATWRPMSLAPLETLNSVMALAPPIAVFLATCSLDNRSRRRLTIVLVALALMGLGVGVLQMTTSRFDLHFYGRNERSFDGFFSNRNHHATLLVCLIPLALHWIDLRSRQKVYVYLAAAAAVFFLMVAIALVKSRAGIGLLGLSLLLSAGLVLRRTAGIGRVQLIAAASALAVILAVGGFLAYGPLMERFNAALAEGRVISLPVVLKTALTYLPLGSGIGSFIPVYQGAEPIEYMLGEFWNHAHNDYAELLLEGGVPAVIAVLAFVGWWGVKTRQAWRQPLSRAANLECAASIVVGLVLLHSLVDYPLRTLCISTVFAYACGILASPASATATPKTARR